MVISSCVSSRLSLLPTMTLESPSQETTLVGSSTPNQESAAASVITTCCPCVTHTCRGTACPLSGPPALETRVCISEWQPVPANHVWSCVWSCVCVWCLSACRADGFRDVQHRGLHHGYDCYLCLHIQPASISIQHVICITRREEKTGYEFSVTSNWFHFKNDTFFFLIYLDAFREWQL